MTAEPARAAEPPEARPEPVAPRSTPGREIAAIAVDLVVPVAAYYLLRGVGCAPGPALLLASVPTAVFGLHQIVRHRRVDALAAFVLAVLAGSVLISAITGSPRFLLAKGAFFTAAIGLVFLGSFLARRPLAFVLARDMLGRTPWGARFDVGSWDVHWAGDAVFRRAWRFATGLWAAGMLADAAVRLAMALTLPVDAVPALGSALSVVTFVGLQVIQQVYFARVGLWASLAGPRPVGPAD
ncbi:VC0807 family protein [Parafrankia discariae]|uniref:VC0807 family protein n=1 Tax=Parafrankia discariae TaxID=365528 RepID=UPI0003702064|nr:VC0807 family protein [Parafrankia discariae]